MKTFPQGMEGWVTLQQKLARDTREHGICVYSLDGYKMTQC